MEQKTVESNVLAPLDEELKVPECPLRQDKDPLQGLLQWDYNIPVAWASVKDFADAPLHSRLEPKELQDSKGDFWVIWRYSPRAGGSFWIRDPNGDDDITGSQTGVTPLRVQKQAALSYHLCQHNLYHGWLRHLPLATSAPYILDEYLQRGN